MQITIVPASPRTGQAAILTLLASSDTPTVVAIYRDPSRAPQDLVSHPSFKAVKGDVDDAASLDFSGSDAVISITPPIYDERDAIAHAEAASQNVKAAAKKAGVKRLVYVSSVGAQYDHGTGEILTNHAAEQVLADAAPEVVFVRCTYFMENWASALETVFLETPFLFSTITPLDYKVPMVSATDIGTTIAKEALAAGTPLPASPHIYELQGPRSYTPLDVQAAFEEALGKKIELRPVPPEGLHDFFSQVFPPAVVSLWVEMSACFLPGALLEADIGKTERNAVRGVVELREVVKGLCGGAKA